MKVYRIRHKETGELWETKNGKRYWAKPGYAKSAWALNMNKRYQKDKILFNEQYEYEIVEYIIVERDKYEEYHLMDEVFSQQD